MAGRRFLEADDVGRTIEELRDALVDPGTVVAPDAPISRVIEALLERPQSRTVHVVDADGLLLGTVSWRSVRKAAGARLGVRREGFLPLVGLFRELGRELARDLMRPAAAVTLDRTLRDVLLLMEERQENDLPVVDASRRLVGEVNSTRIMRVALDTFRSTEAATERARRET